MSNLPKVYDEITKIIDSGKEVLSRKPTSYRAHGNVVVWSLPNKKVRESVLSSLKRDYPDCRIDENPKISPTYFKGLLSDHKASFFVVTNADPLLTENKIYRELITDNPFHKPLLLIINTPLEETMLLRRMTDVDQGTRVFSPLFRWFSEDREVKMGQRFLKENANIKGGKATMVLKRNREAITERFGSGSNIFQRFGRNLKQYILSRAEKSENPFSPFRVIAAMIRGESILGNLSSSGSTGGGFSSSSSSFRPSGYRSSRLNTPISIDDDDDTEEYDSGPSSRSYGMRPGSEIDWSRGRQYSDTDYYDDEDFEDDDYEDEDFEDRDFEDNDVSDNDIMEDDDETYSDDFDDHPEYNEDFPEDADVEDFPREDYYYNRMAASRGARKDKTSLQEKMESRLMSGLERFRKYLQEDDDKDDEDDDEEGDEDLTGKEPDLVKDEEEGQSEDLIKEIPPVDNVGEALKNIVDLLTPEEMVTQTEEVEEVKESGFIPLRYKISRIREASDDEGELPEVEMAEVEEDQLPSGEDVAIEGVDTSSILLALSILQGVANSTDSDAIEALRTIVPAIRDAAQEALDDITGEEKEDKESSEDKETDTSDKEASKEQEVVQDSLDFAEIARLLGMKRHLRD